MSVTKRVRINISSHALLLTACHVVAVKFQVVFVKLDEFAPVPADGHMTVLNISVERFGGFMACRNCVYGKLRTGVDISADEDILLSRLISELVGNGIIAVPIFNLCSVKEAAPFYRLTDSKDNLSRRNGYCLILIVER